MEGGGVGGLKRLREKKKKKAGGGLVRVVGVREGEGHSQRHYCHQHPTPPSSRGNCKGTWGWWGVRRRVGGVNAPRRIFSFGIGVVVGCFVSLVVVAH